MHRTDPRNRSNGWGLKHSPALGSIAYIGLTVLRFWPSGAATWTTYTTTAALLSVAQAQLFVANFTTALDVQVQSWLQAAHADKRSGAPTAHHGSKADLSSSRPGRMPSCEASSEATTAMRELAADLEAVAEGLQDRDGYQRVGQKHLYMVSQIHASQRSTTTGISSLQQSLAGTPAGRVSSPGPRDAWGSSAHAHAAHTQARKKPRRQGTLARVSQAECEWTTTTSLDMVDVAATRRSSCLEGTPERVRKLLEASGSTWQPPVCTGDLGPGGQQDLGLCDGASFYEGASSMLPDACAFVTAVGGLEQGPSFDDDDDGHARAGKQAHGHVRGQEHPPPSVAYGATAELQARMAGDSGNATQKEHDTVEGVLGVDGLSLNVGTYQDLGAVPGSEGAAGSAQRTDQQRVSMPSQPQRQAVLVEQSLKALEGLLF